MEDLINYGKGVIKNATKKFAKGLIKKNPYIIAIIAAIFLIILIFFAILGAAGAAEAAESENGMQSATGSSLEQFIRYLHSWEGGGTIYKNEKGEDCYKVTNGAVGYGVDIATHGVELKKAGYSTSAEALIPVSVVDPIEQQEINDRIKDIEALAADLTQYQKYALVSRTYNYGLAGGTEQATYYFIYPSTLTFIEAYEKYYNNINNDNYYGDYTKTDFNNGLWKDYMIWLDYGEAFGPKLYGTHPSGWETRRKSEWSLFQTGYYGWDIKNGGSHGMDEYWTASSGAEGFIDNSNVYNSDGSVNETAILQLKSTLEDTYNLVKGPNRLNADQSIGGQYNKKACEAVTGDYFKFTSWCSEGKPDSVFGHTHMYQCPWWAKARASSYLGKKVTSSGNGCDVAKNMVSDGYGKSSDVPVANSVISYGSGTGHVAYIEAVDTVNKYYYISHAGSGQTWHGIYKISYKNGLKNSSCFGYSFAGICVLGK